MTNDEWAKSTNAPAMLEALYLQDPEHFKTLIPNLHQYFLACCWKIKNLIPQKHLRNGLRGAQSWIDGEITEEQFRKFDWHAESECFAIEQAESPEEIQDLRTLIESISELDGLPFQTARQRLQNAAYFVNSAMCYSALNTVPYDYKLSTSEFLNADLLREYVPADFQGPPKKEALEPYKPIPFRTAFGKIRGPLPNFR